MPQLDGRTALIAGASSGMGRATALRFAQEGAKVMCVDRLLDSAHETVDLLKKDRGDGSHPLTLSSSEGLRPSARLR